MEKIVAQYAYVVVSRIQQQPRDSNILPNSRKGRRILGILGLVYKQLDQCFPGLRDSHPRKKPTQYWAPGDSAVCWQYEPSNRAASYRGVLRCYCRILASIRKSIKTQILRKLDNERFEIIEIVGGVSSYPVQFKKYARSRLMIVEIIALDARCQLFDSHETDLARFW